MWYLECLLHITVNPALVTITRSAAAADQDQRLEQLWMIEPKLQGHDATDADSRYQSFTHSFLPADAYDVLIHLYNSRGGSRLIRVAIASKINVDTLKKVEKCAT